MIIRYADGSYAHAAICRLTGGTLNAAVAGVEGAVEFRLIRGAWTTGRGLVVTFEFPHEVAVALLRTMAGTSMSEEPGECVAGGDCVLRRISAAGGGEPLN